MQVPNETLEHDYKCVLLLKLLSQNGSSTSSELQKKFINCVEKFDLDFLPELKPGLLQNVINELEPSKS